MAKIDLSESKKLFDLAIGYANAAERDQHDPASANLLMALHNYFQSTATTLVAIAEAVERLDTRLEAMERGTRAGAAGLATRLK